MKSNIVQIILSDKYTLVVTGASIILTIFLLISYISINSLERKNKNLSTQLSEVQTLQDEAIQIKDLVESKERKIGLVKTTGVVSTLEPMLGSLGLKAKVLKPLEKMKINDFTEEGAELEIENIDLNKIVNLLYKMEHSSVPLKIKSSDIKTTFENPNMFVFHLTTALISK
jgi:hypothetical protein